MIVMKNYDIIYEHVNKLSGIKMYDSSSYYHVLPLDIVEKQEFIKELLRISNVEYTNTEFNYYCQNVFLFYDTAFYDSAFYDSAFEMFSTSKQHQFNFDIKHKPSFHINNFGLGTIHVTSLEQEYEYYKQKFNRKNILKYL